MRPPDVTAQFSRAQCAASTSISLVKKRHAAYLFFDFQEKLLVLLEGWSLEIKGTTPRQKDNTLVNSMKGTKSSPHPNVHICVVLFCFAALDRNTAVRKSPGRSSIQLHVSYCGIFLLFIFVVVVLLVFADWIGQDAKSSSQKKRAETMRQSQHRIEHTMKDEGRKHKLRTQSGCSLERHLT